MNRTDAATILSIEPTASPEEANRAYQELFTEHQVRLTNAPTPALRSLYQARLLELDDARNAFLAASANDADLDLPTDQPSIPAYNRAPQSAAPPPPGTSQPSSPQAPREPARTPPPSASAPGSSARADETTTPAKERTVRTEEKPVTPDAEASRRVAAKKSGVPKALPLLLGVVVVALSLWQLARMRGTGSSATSAADSAASVSPAAHVADSLPKIREDITVARVEFGRGDYDAANGALKEADMFYSHLPAGAANDTAVALIKSQLDSLHTKVQRACDALKKVAERHPGEPTCKSL